MSRQTVLRPRMTALVSIVVAIALIVAWPGEALAFGGSLLSDDVEATDRAGSPGFADIVQKVAPAVVSVRALPEHTLSSFHSGEAASRKDLLPSPYNSLLDHFLRHFEPADLPKRSAMRHFAFARGSGFLISSDGLAVTSNLVVGNARSLEITTRAGESYSGRVVGSDPTVGIALMKIKGRYDFPYVKFAVVEPRIGDWVLAVGNRHGLGETVSAGIISASGGRDTGATSYGDFMLVDIPVNKGVSGGPAFDSSGHVVGMITTIYSPSDSSLGICFAIPADIVESAISRLRADGS